MGFDPLPTYIPPEEADRDGGGEYPLTLLSPPEHTFLNSTFANVPSLAARAGEARLLITPRDASERGIRTGDRLRIRNARGEFFAAATITDDVVPGTVVSYGVRWPRLSEGGQTVNDTTSQRLSDLGGGATFYDNAVEVEVLSTRDAGGTATVQAGEAVG